jgi:UDP-N-acetyl-D-mannosaminuronate dehydrogenase
VNNSGKVVVVGLGEIGKPLLKIVSGRYEAVGVDISPIQPTGPTEVLHICYPFQIQDFIGETIRYIDLFNPALTIINSTVPVGTTRTIARRTQTVVVNSPVRGKHAHMLEELRQYTKFIGAINPSAGHQAARHFESVGLSTKVLSSPEATELAKLTETTYFGLMIAWAQQVERYCDRAGQDYEEVVAFYEEIKFLPPVKYFPGIIGGHCVIPNIQILNEWERSGMLDAIRASNQMKIDREANNQKSVAAVTVETT